MSIHHQDASSHHKFVTSPHRQRVISMPCPDADAYRVDATDVSVDLTSLGLGSGYSYTITGGEITGSYSGSTSGGTLLVRMPERQTTTPVTDYYFRRGNAYHYKLEVSVVTGGSYVAGSETWDMGFGFEAFAFGSYLSQFYEETTLDYPPAATGKVTLSDYITEYPYPGRCSGVYFYLRDFYLPPMSAGTNFIVRVRIYRDGTTPNFT